ncbi:DinB family protein [Planctomyces sp. SH-PL14]|uniref:DinB family protein n=1 Tax=Planctomyces sp. SH-PL14 TaxID=1632864 RepID=UPI00078E781F|nr:DinB family protein [Planctomyces sp. SH-PL14]AMV19054.1 DinB superfamily protein [Planctomyces sp. SH-PL14]
MSFGQTLLPEFDQEMAGTRKVLERIPDDKLDWKAHPKSNTIRWVGTHLATIPSWTGYTLHQDSLDVNPPGGPELKTTPAASRQEILDRFDQNVAQARKDIETTADAEFMKPWTLINNGTRIFTLPKAAVLRSFVLNHIIHHRAHLCVYLRLNDIPVPGLYGPSGDED